MVRIHPRPRAGFCPGGLLPDFLYQAGVHPRQDHVEMDGAPLSPADGEDVLQLFPRLPVKFPQPFAEPGDVVPDFFGVRSLSRRIGEGHPQVSRMEITVQQVEAVLHRPLVLPALHFLRRGMFPAPLLVLRPHWFRVHGPALY